MEFAISHILSEWVTEDETRRYGIHVLIIGLIIGSVLISCLSVNICIEIKLLYLHMRSNGSHVGFFLQLLKFVKTLSIPHNG